MKTQPNSIPTAPLVAVCLAWTLAGLLLISYTAIWAIVGFFCSIALRLLSHRFGWPLPSQPVKLVFLALGVALTGITYGTFRGMEPGIGILLLVTSLKVLETKSARDFQVLVILGYFLGLCDLLFSQDLGRTLVVGLIVALLTIALIRSQRGVFFAPAFRLAAVMALQALPITILLFLVFPKISGGPRVQMGASPQNTTGMSDDMEPGSISSLASEDDIAFQVSFPKNNVPAEADLYWRGAVLWTDAGLSWYRGKELTREKRAQFGETIQQQIILQPHGGNWLFALDLPASNALNATNEFGNCLRSRTPITSTLLYDVFSRPGNREKILPPDQLAAALQKPPHISPTVQKLVDGWRQDATDQNQIIRRALMFFGKNFQYSLNPGVYEANDLDEFLFHRKIGFCEHYAGAFASLMRIAEIPSRVVLGYHGGAYNGIEVTVRQSDAHAWCEVWLKGVGWQRVDPTIIIAPERITEGWDSYRASHASADNLSSAFGLKFLRHFRDQTHLFWANLTFQWDLHVLNYGTEQKNSLLTHLGIPLWHDNELLLGVGGILLLVLTAITLWLIRPRSAARDAGVRWFERFCRILAAAGMERQPWEGPLHFSTRAAERFPEKAAAIQSVGRIYAQHRYGKAGAPLEELARAVRSLGRFPKGKT